MIRCSFFLSLCLHLALLGFAGVFVSEQSQRDAQTEKRFQVSLRKQMTARTSSSSSTSGVPRKSRSNPLLPNTPDVSPLHSAVQKTQRKPIVRKTEPVQVSPRVPTPPVPTPQVQEKIPTTQESVVTARHYPTPVPTPKQKAAATPKPKPTPIQRTPEKFPLHPAVQKLQRKTLSRKPTPVQVSPHIPTPTAPTPLIQEKIPTPREFVRTARNYPTPVPTPTTEPTHTPKPNPTPVPTPKPKPTATPIPAKTPTQIRPTQTPVRPTPTRTRPPVTSPQVADATPLPASEPKQPLSSPAKNATTKTASTQEGQPSDTSAQNRSDLQGTGQSQGQQNQALLYRYSLDVAKRINKVKKYPQRARKKGWEGTVEIRLYITSDGTLEKAEVTTPSKYNTLDNAALKAIQKAQPFPEFYEGLPRETIIINIPIQFTLH